MAMFWNAHIYNHDLELSVDSFLFAIFANNTKTAFLYMEIPVVHLHGHKGRSRNSKNGMAGENRLSNSSGIPDPLLARKMSSKIPLTSATKFRKVLETLLIPGGQATDG